MTEPNLAGPTRECPRCGAEVDATAKFCGFCAAELDREAPTGDADRVREATDTQPTRRRWPAAIALVVLLALTGALLAAAVIERTERRDATGHLGAQLASQAKAIASLQAQDATLAQRLQRLDATVNRQGQGLAPLAQRVLRSVYTVESGQELGTAWVAWKTGQESYLITARHVVADAVAAGERSVTLKRKAGSLRGTVVRTDSINDLAVVETSGTVGPALWQSPQLGVLPLVGDPLLLVGSPYGLEGTVTQGVVSRVTYDQIQTDAAANPGNSGGPAVDRQGQVVGVLLEGGGENLNFAVPIQRVCVSLRSC